MVFGVRRKGAFVSRLNESEMSGAQAECLQRL
jgi:hypothetical protein